MSLSLEDVRRLKEEFGITINFNFDGIPPKQNLW